MVESRGYTREELFHAKERPCLGHLPAVPYEVKHFSEQTVDPTGKVTIREDGHSYTVPYQHTGRKAHLEYTRSTLSVYVDNVCVCTHARVHSPGETVVVEHLSPAGRAYHSRTPQTYMSKAAEISAPFGSLAAALFSARGRGMSNDVIFGMLDRLAVRRRRSDAAIFDRSCEICVQNGLLREDDIVSIANVLKSNADSRTDGASAAANPSNHENTRGREYYS